MGLIACVIFALPTIAVITLYPVPRTGAVPSRNDYYTRTVPPSEAVRNGLTLEVSTGQTEGQVSPMTMLKRTM